MKQYVLVTFLMVTLNAFGQSELVFNKKYVQSEDKWVAFSPDSTGVHKYGFIYIDQSAGLSMEYYGSFRIDESGTYKPKDKEVEGSIKYRLEPNDVLVAHIPEEKFSELGVEKTPEWLKYYKEGENTVERQYQWGYQYNAWGECRKALEHLNKAYEMNPKYKGLRVELAYSHNCLKEYDKAIKYIMQSMQDEPVTAYAIKELIYAQAQKGKPEDAENTYNLFYAKISDKAYLTENAFNILQGYFITRDAKNFNRWLKESKIEDDERFEKYIEQMSKRLN